MHLNKRKLRRLQVNFALSSSCFLFGALQKGRGKLVFSVAIFSATGGEKACQYPPHPSSPSIAHLHCTLPYLVMKQLLAGACGACSLHLRHHLLCSPYIGRSHVFLTRMSSGFSGAGIPPPTPTPCFFLSLPGKFVHLTFVVSG